MSEKSVKLTANQRMILDAVKRWKEREQVGAMVSELHESMRATMSAATLRTNLGKLRDMGLVWSYGCSMTGNGTCWHPDPPEDAGRAHPAAATP